MKWIKTIIIALLLPSILVACSTNSGQSGEGKINIVTTFYPLYELAKQIGGSHVQVTCLVPTGIEPHDWTPKVKDMQLISDADLFIYNGAGFEGWVDDFIQNQSNPNLVRIEASAGVKLIKTHNDSENHGLEGVDPHIWTSPIGAAQMAKNIYDEIIKMDSAHSAVYKQNYEKTKRKLTAIKKKYEAVVAQASKKQIVVSHEAFGYLARDFGIKQIAIMGLSPESEPTAQDLKNISDQIAKYGVRYILIEKLSSPKLAETLAKDLNVATIEFNPLEGLTAKEQKAGMTYFDLFESNAETLRKALQ